LGEGADQQGMRRRHFLAGSAALAGGALLPLPAAAQGAIHELAGEVRVNGRRIDRRAAIRGGDVIVTGGGGSLWFTLGGDAFLVRSHSELRLVRASARDTLISALRLISGAIGATFARGAARSLYTPTVTVGIRGTGVYLEANARETYACTCFGATDMMSAQGGDMMERVQVLGATHNARRIFREPKSGMRIERASFERHTNEEIARLEMLAGRADPFARKPA
jgi:hypothetical protein